MNNLETIEMLKKSVSGYKPKFMQKTVTRKPSSGQYSPQRTNFAPQTSFKPTFTNVLQHQCYEAPAIVTTEQVSYSPVREVREVVAESVRVSPVSSKYMTVNEEEEGSSPSPEKSYVEVQE